MKGHVEDRWWTKATPTRPKRKKADYGQGLRWLGVIDIPGRRSPLRERFEYENQAWGWVRKQNDLLESGAQPGNQTLAEFSIGWLDSQLQFASLTDDAVRARWRLHILPSLGRWKMDDIESEHVQLAVVEWGETLAPGTVKVAYSYLKSAMRYAKAKRIISRDPCIGINLPRSNKAPRVPLSEDQVFEIAETLPEHFYAMAILAAQTGMRIAELRGLTKDRINFDLDGAIITVDRQLKSNRGGQPVWGQPKGKRAATTDDPPVRTIKIDQETADVLRNHMIDFPAHRSGLIFTSAIGSPMGKNIPVNAWTKAVAKMTESDGGDLTGWHAFRHYHASVLIDGGESLTNIQRRLGHSSAQVTLNTYAHWWKANDEKSRRIITRLWKSRSKPPVLERSDTIENTP